MQNYITFRLNLKFWDEKLWIILLRPVKAPEWWNKARAVKTLVTPDLKETVIKCFDVIYNFCFFLFRARSSNGCIYV